MKQITIKDIAREAKVSVAISKTEAERVQSKSGK